MSLTSTQINHINRMNRASQDVRLGTLVDGFVSHQVTSGSLTASASQASASAITVSTGLDSISGYIVQGFRSGSAISNVYIASNTSGSLTFKSGSTVTSGDRYNWIAW